MKTRILRARTHSAASRPWWVAPAACLATLLALPVSAGITIPDDPLTTGNKVAPNILFILDDSGSMAFETMPEDYNETKTSNYAVNRFAYTKNTLSYNPATTYQPWLKADGTRWSDTGYDAVYASFNLAGTKTVSLYDSSSCNYYNRNESATKDSGDTKVCGGTQTFYVPKDLKNKDKSYLGDGMNYYRYQIHSDGAVIRSWYGARSGKSPDYNRGLSGRGCSTGKGNDWRECQQVTPTGRSEEAERANYANWFSYHRTRMKAAKAGASEAFGALSGRVRVGFRTIHGRGANHASPIPVGNGDGRFIDDSAKGLSNRTAWYSSLHSAIGQSGTPLHSALDQAGKYFSADDASGAYGPESGTAQFSCRQNFSILTTDGYWNSGTQDVGDQDSKAGPTILGPIVDSKQKSYKFPAGSPFADGRSGTLADVAMKYWKNDLRTEDHMGNSSKPDGNNVPSSDADPAFWQHMVTFGISIGLSGTSGLKSVAEVKSKSSVSWNDPTDKEDSDRIDDLLHAAVNGHGEFVAATDPKEFASGLSKALAAISQRTSSFSNVATNAASIKSGGKVFNASYVAGLWTGAVRAWTLDKDTNEPTDLAWDASIPATGRKVFTVDGSSVVPFPTDTQRSALARSGGTLNYEVTGSDNAAYIKGDSTLEERNGGLLRNRASTVLGDIVNSSPAYVDDTKTLYVGANDGMLHAFDANTGVEQFAYVPSLVNMGDLSQLSRGDYSHKWFVDGPVVVTSRKLTPGKNYLVGAMGRGGKGLFGLDVTDPGSFGTGNVTWELGGSDADMGLVTGRPILARVGGGTVAAILGNGVNSTGNKAVLYVINAATGAIIRKLDTGAGDAANPNGLSAPTGILGRDGRTLAYAYAGDRLGNVWKFDMSSASPASWTVTRMFTAKAGPAGTGAIQPITGGVTVATDPRTYKRWVFFGTGSYMTTTEADDKTPGTQGMYGIIDTGSTVTKLQLKGRSIINTGATQDGYPVRTFEAKADLDSEAYAGWYMDLPGKGERIVQDAQLVSNILVTASMIPEGDACEASGSGYINALDAFTGTSAGKSFFDLDKDGDTTDQKVGGVPVGSVNFGVGMPTLPIFLDGKLIVGGTNAGEKPGSGGIVGKEWSRVSWREIRKD